MQEVWFTIDNTQLLEVKDGVTEYKGDGKLDQMQSKGCPFGSAFDQMSVRG